MVSIRISKIFDCGSSPYWEAKKMTAKIIQFNEKKKEAICSFCKKPKSKVRKMAGTDSAVICDVCLAKCTQLVKEDNE